MNYLVTGGTGLIGAYVVAALARDGHRVTVYDLMPNRAFLEDIIPPDAMARVTIVSGDVTDLPFLLRTLRENETERVVHLAALLTRKSDESPLISLRVNCEGTINIFEAALTLGIPKVVWGSSIAVFGPPSRRPAGPVANDAYHNPNDLYGACKSLCERFARHYRRARKLDCVGLRFPLVFGYGKAQTLARGTGGAFLVDLIDKPALGIPGKVPAGGAICDFLYIEDAANAVVLASQTPNSPSAALTICGHRTSIRGFVEIVGTVVPGAEIEVEDGSWQGTNHHYDAETARREIGYAPKFSLERGIRRSIEQVRQRQTAIYQLS